MSSNEIERLIYTTLCRNCPSKELCGELGESCQEYDIEMKSALKDNGENYEKN